MVPDLAAPAAKRMEAVDAARGTAMLLVFFAHFSDAFFRPFVSTDHHHPLLLLTRMASPAFMCISGLMLGILHHGKRDRFGSLRDRLIDRGLFLVLVGHPLLTVAMIWIWPTWSDAVRVLFITDTIGFCLIVGSLLITRLGPGARVLVGAGLLFTHWVLLMFWMPDSEGPAWWAKVVLIGVWRPEGLTYNFPPLPWLGLYLMASALGGTFARLYEEGKRRRLQITVFWTGLAAISLGLFLKEVFAHSAELVSSASFADHLVSLGFLTQKMPPSPAYLAFYGGAALVMLSFLLAIEQTTVGRMFIRWAALFGRTSLACFVAQFYVYYVGVFLLPRPPVIFVPIYFLATVVLMRVIARVWDETNGNRLFTVGYPRIAQRWRSAKSDEQPTLRPGYR